MEKAFVEHREYGARVDKEHRRLKELHRRSEEQRDATIKRLNMALEEKVSNIEVVVGTNGTVLHLNE